MGAVCVWLSTEGSDPAPRTLDGMAAAFRGGRLRSGIAAAPRRAARVSSASPSASLSHAEEPWAVIVGTPGWRLPALAEAQQAEGAAAALRLAYREQIGRAHV